MRVSILAGLSAIVLPACLLGLPSGAVLSEEDCSLLSGGSDISYFDCSQRELAAEGCSKCVSGHLCEESHYDTLCSPIYNIPAELCVSCGTYFIDCPGDKALWTNNDCTGLIEETTSCPFEYTDASESDCDVACGT